MPRALCGGRVLLAGEGPGTGATGWGDVQGDAQGDGLPQSRRADWVRGGPPIRGAGFPWALAPEPLALGSLQALGRPGLPQLPSGPLPV